MRDQVKSSGLFISAETEKKVPDAPKANNWLDIAVIAWENVALGQARTSRSTAPVEGAAAGLSWVRHAIAVIQGKNDTGYADPTEPGNPF